MGSVWKAVHRTLGRPFAIKFLKPYDLDVERQQERFLQEARLAAAVSHHFVVDIVDYGMTDEATPYLVMEYLQGESLGARLRREPSMTVRELLRVISAALHGLEAVHQAGVIHRDIKPENILLVPEAGGVIPKLVDFSISRSELVEVPIGESPALRTIPGSAVGTPWYMAPEQAEGAGRVCRRSDVYSVGVILYEALSGVMPFDGPDVDAVLLAVVEGKPRALAEACPAIPPALAAVVERAMRYEPAERLTAAEMAAALDALVVPEALVCADLSGRPQPPSQTEHARPPRLRGAVDKTMIVSSRRGRDSVAIAGLCALAAVLFFANHYASSKEARARPAPKPAPVAEVAPPPASPLAGLPTEPAEPAAKMAPPRRARRGEGESRVSAQSRRPERPRPAPDFFRDPGF
jgi:serine/threonine protein kinase